MTVTSLALTVTQNAGKTVACENDIEGKLARYVLQIAACNSSIKGLSVHIFVQEDSSRRWIKIDSTSDVNKLPGAIHAVAKDLTDWVQVPSEEVRNNPLIYGTTFLDCTVLSTKGDEGRTDFESKLEFFDFVLKNCRRIKDVSDLCFVQSYKDRILLIAPNKKTIDEVKGLFERLLILPSQKV